MPARNPILFLENELKMLEDLSFVLAHVARLGLMKGDDGDVVAPSGIWVNLAKLRPFVLGRRPELTFEDFETPVNADADNARQREDLRILHTWCHASRKAYVITDELKALLCGMSLGELEWTDLVFPHDAFALAFETPLDLPSADGPIRVCGLMFSWLQSNPDATPSLVIKLYSEEVLAYQPLGEYEKSKLRQPQGQLRRLADALKQLQQRLGESPRVRMQIDARCLYELRIQDTNTLRSPNSDQSDYSELYRLIAGFCFYLQTLPPGSPHRSAWTGVKNPGKPDPNAITNGAEICMVSSSVTLTAEERKAFGGEGRLTDRELSAHFRRGHFRRAPGTGNDPTAPKVVLVRPTLVRKDRLQPGELVGGSEIMTKLS